MVETLEITGEVLGDTVKMVIDGKTYEAKVDENGEFEIELAQELLAQSISTFGFVVLCVVTVAIVGFSLYEIAQFVVNFHSSDSSYH